MVDDVKWAFDVFGVDRSTGMHAISRGVAERCASVRHDDDDVEKIRLAKAIVLAIARKDALANGARPFTLVETDDATGFQQVLLHTLRRLNEQGYEKRGDACMKEILSNDVQTQAWRQVCNVREFILTEITKETEPLLWRHLYTPRDTLDCVSKHIVNVECSEFPSQKVDPTLVAWTNGIYCVKDNVFWPFDEKEKWSELAAVVQAERRAAGWKKDYSLLPPHASLTACNYVDREFRVGDSSAMQRIADLIADMGVDREAQVWLFILLGRLFFEVRQMDNWQVMPYCKTSETADGIAMSAFCEPFRILLGSDSVAQIVSGVNVHHSLGMLMNARISAMLLRDCTPMEQGDWQAATAGEEVVISGTRGKTPFPIRWKSHLVGVGPLITYKNDAATVERRIVMFDFSRASSDQFEKLRGAICSNVDAWAQTLVAAYLSAVHEHGDADLWRPGVLPPSLSRARAALSEMISPLHSCIASSLFNRDTGSFMPLTEFKDVYYDFRRRRGLPVQRWVKDHWHATFQEFGLSIERAQKEYNSIRTTTDWVIGIDTVDKTNRPEIEVSDESITQMEQELVRLNCDADRLRVRIQISKDLLAADAEVCKQKEKRNALREQLRDHLTENASCGEDAARHML